MNRTVIRPAILVLTALFAASTASNAVACGKNPGDGFMPKNKMNIPPRREVIDRNGRPAGGGITQKEFNAVIDAVESVYAPIVHEMGGTLRTERLWTNGQVNAEADRDGNDWILTMFGGLARHPETTPDAFMLVVCHELGHQIGGAPKKNRGIANEWASNEGEADYFATLKCARRVLANQNNLRAIRSAEIPEIVAKSCNHEFRDPKDAAICARTSVAALALGRLLASGDEEFPGETMPNFDTIDKSKVTRTFDGHPEAQCRLDTMFNGALCNVDYTVNVDQTDPTVGTCNQEKGDKEGFRPRCWYAPKANNESVPFVRGLRPRSRVHN